MPTVFAPECVRTFTESAAITTLAAGLSGRSASQQHGESENMVPSTSLGNPSGLDIPRQSAASRRGAGDKRGGLSDITNFTENGYPSVKVKPSTRQRLKRPSDALRDRTSVHATGQAPARLPARPVVPPVPQTWMAVEGDSLVEIRSPAHEQDVIERTNPQECKEYELEIVAGLFAEETSYMPRPDYMVLQPDINGKMRSILVDWLVEVHMKYKLRHETLFLAVSLIDRYLAALPVPRACLQLVGVVCMFVAAKFEQINPPQVADFVYITDNTYTKEEVLSMECTLLSALSFNIAVPTQAHFLDYLLRANQCVVEEYRALVHYLLDLALIDVRVIKYAPSKLVSAALLLSNEIMGRPTWPDRMVQVSRYSDTALRGCVEELRGLLRAAPSGALQAVRKKYLLQQHRSIARLPEVLAA